MKKLLLFILLSMFSFSFQQSLFAQKKDHVDGELLIMLEPSSLVNSISGLNHNVGGKQIWIRHTRTLSKMMNIHLFSFPHQEIDEYQVLAYMERHPDVAIVQYNHYVESRATTPNDPQFGTLWGMNNTGQSGGTVDADIDAPEAWDINTGGMTSTGDTVVLAIIDGGFDLNHEDIDFWQNHNEIPGNNIDDDGNGWIDDVNGWDAYSSSGSVSTSGSHGTHVAGTAGAIGNNNIGVSGVCWNAQIMAIGGSSGTESIVIEAYAYARDNRRLYNTTNGAKGAFVVATNSSFGVNNGLPINFPLWCAMYDSLGAVGIISAAATMNSAQNVDTQSDIPTACPSDWMVAVTNTTRNDGLNSGAAWGATTIDVGAPGTDVLSTTPSNTYQTFTGTSMATPHVCGSMGLIISAACPSLIADYKNNPSAVALTFRDFLYDGVDTIPALLNITTTSGRINVFKSLQLVNDWCATGGCVTPFSLSVSNVSDSAVTLNWGSISASKTYDIRWKATSSGTWTMNTDSVNSLQISGLQGCTEYEFQVMTNCDTSASAWSPSYTFFSEGCCTAPKSPDVISTTDTTAQVFWKPVYAAQGYTIEYRVVGASTWLTYNSTSDTAWLTGLETCTDYEFQVETVCDTGGSGYSVIQTFKTKGCGLCAEGAYCSSELNSDDEWVESVLFNTINNVSGDDGGYGDYTSMSTTVNRGQTYTITLTPGFGGFQFSEQFRVFIDLNDDSDFADPGELVYDSGSAASNQVTGNISIPASATLGKTRMRVSMRFNTGSAACDMTASGNTVYGEVEDYCVTVLDTLVGTSFLDQNAEISLYPNPSQGHFTLLSNVQVDQIIITDLFGKIVFRNEVPFIGERNISLDGLPAAVYLVNVISKQGRLVKKLIKE